MGVPTDDFMHLAAPDASPLDNTQQYMLDTPYINTAPVNHEAASPVAWDMEAPLGDIFATDNLDFLDELFAPEQVQPTIQRDADDAADDEACSVVAGETSAMRKERNRLAAQKSRAKKRALRVAAQQEEERRRKEEIEAPTRRLRAEVDRLRHNKAQLIHVLRAMRSVKAL